VIILDDPFANLDIHYTLFLEELLNDYVNENSATVFVTTHFMLTLKPSDYMVLQQGKIVAKESLEKIPVGKPIRYHIRFGNRNIVTENYDEALKLIRKGARITKVDTYEYVDWLKDVITH
jgi:ABC-type multidrug transport system ATPase subunit